MNKLVTLLFHDVYVRSPSESGFHGPGAERYKLTVENFRCQLASVAKARSDAPVLLEGSAGERKDSVTPFAISVDDGGVSYHSIIGPCLEEHGWRGHCMVTTGRIGRQGFLTKGHLRELHAAGHVIGSHSVTHPAQFSSCSWRQLIREWSHSREVLEDIIGAPVITGSVPGGYYSRRVAVAAREAGLQILLTSEPEQKMRMVDDCQVFGRYTLRRDSAPNLAGRLVQSGAARLEQWCSWNAKKVLKKTLGPRYVQFTGWLARDGAGGSA